MKAAPFEYARAASLAEACALLATHGDSAKLLAGGQSLVPMMAMRLVRPAWLVDINEIAALKFVKLEKDAARIGACTRQCVVDRLSLMGIQPGNATRSQRAPQAGVERLREERELRRHRGQTPQCRDVQIWRVGPVRHLTGRQTLQRLIERPVSPGSRDETGTFGYPALRHEWR